MEMGTISITDMYMSILNSLSNEEKLDLISKLTNSMLHKQKKTTVDMSIFDRFHKDWGGKGTPEQIADDLRHSRTFHRDIDLW